MKHLPLIFLLTSLLTLSYCTTSKTAMNARDQNKKMPTYTYTTDIAPIMQARCTPCHFPDGGKKKFLDTHAAVTTHIDDILYRIQLPADSIRFMPFKSKKEPLSDSLIQVFIAWKRDGMPQ